MSTSLSPARDTKGTARRPVRGDTIAYALAVLLVAAAAGAGALLKARGIGVHADAAPLFARWLPHVGPGTAAAMLLAMVLVRHAAAWAARWPWRRLLVAAYCAAVAWTLSLALVDGWSRGLTGRLTRQAEYLHDVPRVHGIGSMLAGFSAHILDFRPGSWTTHVAGHPPGALLVFVVLDRIGLGGGGPAALLCVLVGASAAVSVAVSVRALGGETAARATLPFLVLFPGAVWLGVSADSLFTGVVAAGLALLCVGGWRAATVGGLLLGYAVYLSYGLVLAAVLAAVVLWLRPAPRLPVLAAAGGGALAVAVAFSLAGFWWPTGYRLVAVRYYQGWAHERPYGYWVFANLACVVVSAGPAAVPALRRAVALGAGTVRGLLRRGGGLSGGGAAVAVWVPLAALAAMLAADLSGLSKAEVERIWLPFEVWLLPAMALLPARVRRGALAVQAVTALAVNHLLLTNW